MGPSLGEEAGMNQASRRLLAYIVTLVFADTGGTENQPADIRTVAQRLERAFRTGFISEEERFFVLDLIEDVNDAIRRKEVLSLIHI